MTHKDELIKRANELRTSHNMPAYNPKKVTMTTMELQAMIDHLERLSPDKKPEAPPPTRAQLVKQLNVLRERAGLKPLKVWKAGYDALEKAINLMQQTIKAKTEVKKGDTKIADGATTTKAKTDLHKNPVRNAMAVMRRKEKAKTHKERKDTAKRIALWAGFKAQTVYDYLEAKDVTRPPLAGDALKKDIREWVKVRDKVLPKKGRQKSSQRLLAEGFAENWKQDVSLILKWLKSIKATDVKQVPKNAGRVFAKWVKERPKAGGHGPRKSAGINVTQLATELKKEPRAIRIKLRSMESKIPKAWRIPDERWGFKTEHKKDILKLLKGE